MANAVANLIKRARRARRGSHSYAIPCPSAGEKSMRDAQSPPAAPDALAIASTRHCMAQRRSYLFPRRPTENLALKKILIDVASDDAVEILAPTQSIGRHRCAVVCLCCEQAGQPMDDDGCGICDACLGLPVGASQDLGGLEFPTPSPHLSINARNR